MLYRCAVTAITADTNSPSLRRARATVWKRTRRAAWPHRLAASAAEAVHQHADSLADEVRQDFPLLRRAALGTPPLVYLDSAATSHKPECVLRAMDAFYGEYNSNVHRGVHALAAQATDAYEAARGKVAAFVNAASDRDIVFTRGATEAINLVAASWGDANLGPGDEIILSVMEHHSNLVPWQMLAARTGCVLRFAGLTPGEELDLDSVTALVGPRTRLLAMAHVSNVLGCVNPVSDLAAIARRAGARLLLDCCQSVPHMPVDVQTLGADFVVASGHKMCGPTGIGFLWARPELLAAMPPWQGGGDMIDEVRLEATTYAPPPARFEAGTPAIAGAIGLGAACDYLRRVGLSRVHDHEQRLATQLWESLVAIPGVRVYGPPPGAAHGRGRAALAAFTVSGVHATDLATLLDHAGVAVRTGHHCTQPLHRHLKVPLFATARASAYLYTATAEIDAFVAELRTAIDFFKNA